MRGVNGPGLWDRFALGVRHGDACYERAMTLWQRLLWLSFVWSVGFGGIGVAVFQLIRDGWVPAVLEGTLAVVWLYAFTRMREVIWLTKDRVVIPGRPVQKVRFGDLLTVDTSSADFVRLEYKGRLGPWSLGLNRDRRVILPWTVSLATRAYRLKLLNRQAFLDDLRERIPQAVGREVADRLFHLDT